MKRLTFRLLTQFADIEQQFWICPPPALVLIVAPWWPLSCLRCCVVVVMVREVEIKVGRNGWNHQK
jgi:hypothetical protein